MQINAKSTVLALRCVCTCVRARVCVHTHKLIIVCILLITLSRLNIFLTITANSEVWLKEKPSVLVRMTYIEGCKGHLTLLLPY